MATKETEAGPAITIALVDISFRWCPHCLTETTQVGELPEKWPEEIPDEPKIVKTMGHCLQCIADGGDCCNLDEFSRHDPEDFVDFTIDLKGYGPVTSLKVEAGSPEHKILEAMKDQGAEASVQ
jgi:hypothetical protein